MSAQGIAAPSGAEMAALRTGLALAKVERDRLDLAGPDRVRFLHNLITCEVRELGAGRSTRGFLTHVKGGVLADVDVVTFEDRFRLVLPNGRGAAIRGHLEKHRIAERVEVAERGDLAAVALRGTGAPALLERIGAAPLEAGEWRRIEIANTSVVVRLEARGREPRVELEGSGAELDDVVTELRRATPLVAVSAAAVELARIEDGELAWGIDYGAENFPQEAGEESALSFSKGCYLGQEVVARIHYRGGVQRLPRRLRFDVGARATPGVELLLDGRSVGRATSIAREPAEGRLVALGVVHRRATVGSRLVSADGDGAEVLNAV